MSRIPLTQEDRDLNKKVALALGWKDLKALKIQSRNSLLLEGISPRHTQPPATGFRSRQHVPNFAGCMNSALELLEELRSRGYHGASLTRAQRTLKNGESLLRWECFLEDPLGRRVAEYADTPARAVCLALLNAMGSLTEHSPAANGQSFQRLKKNLEERGQEKNR
ncbi:MAG: hypothetical protein ACXVB9_09840 [Bdellovibrionota bacterium]